MSDDGVEHIGALVLSLGPEVPPDPATAARILAACIAVRPELRAAKVLKHRVGLRPVRPTVRLEAEQADGVTIVHNYGHGGAGVTLSWGCAHDAAELGLAALS